MCATNDGFKIAEKDLELRGPGEIEGTRQSGVLNFRLASIVNDKDLLEAAKILCGNCFIEDEELIKTRKCGSKSFLLFRKKEKLHGVKFPDNKLKEKNVV